MKDRIDYTTYSDGELADAIAQLSAAKAAIEATLSELVAAFDEKRAYLEDGAPNCQSWLVGRLGIHHRSAKELVRVSRALVELPAIQAALLAGNLSYDQVGELVKFATPQEDLELAQSAPGLSAAQLASLGRRRATMTVSMAMNIDEMRSLRWYPAYDDAAIRISGLLPQADGAQVIAALEAITEHQDHDDSADGIPRSYPALMADALTELASLHLGQDACASRAGVVVHVDAKVLTSGQGSAEVSSGTVAPAVAQRLSCDGQIQVVIEEGRTPIGVGREQRSVPPWLWRMVKRRDQHCVFPGCGHRRWLAAHHMVHWAHGGQTDLDNLVLVCGFHHKLVHEYGWRIRGQPPEGLEFHRPRGTSLWARPEPLRREIATWLVEKFGLPPPAVAIAG